MSWVIPFKVSPEVSLYTKKITQNGGNHKYYVTEIM